MKYSIYGYYIDLLSNKFISIKKNRLRKIANYHLMRSEISTFKSTNELHLHFRVTLKKSRLFTKGLQ